MSTPLTAPVLLDQRQRDFIARALKAMRPKFDKAQDLEAKRIVDLMADATPKPALGDLFLKVLSNLQENKDKPCNIYLYAEGLDDAGFKRIKAAYPIGTKIRYTKAEAVKEAEQISKETGIEFSRPPAEGN